MNRPSRATTAIVVMLNLVLASDMLVSQNGAVAQSPDTQSPDTQSPDTQSPDTQSPGDVRPARYRLQPSENCQFEIQQRLIEAIPGDIIELEAGVYHLTQQLDLVADNITIRGQGSNATTLSFKQQHQGGQGISATGDNLVFEGFAVENTAGNAIKVLGSTNVVFRDVRTEWTGEAKSSNGAYGIYPVQCRNVLIEHCQAIGASDAGIYVGQCHNIVVRNSLAERNVAGIEVENTNGADVHDNVATNNAGGILVFDLPGLQVRSGGDVRVFKNRVVGNNHQNFAAPGNMVASVPSGTGVMVMATDNVEIFANEIQNNVLANVTIVSYLVMGKRQTDTTFDPIPNSISIHDNQIAGGGRQPAGELATILMPVLGNTFPDILYDGVASPEEPRRIRIAGNGDATFVNFDLGNLNAKSIRAGTYRIERSLDAYDVAIAALPKVELPPHGVASTDKTAASYIYKTAPRKLSEFGLFVGELKQQVPAAGVEPYDLNTPLFSDYTSKHRFIRLPVGAAMEYRASGVLEFPVGTTIAKTFSYPADRRDSTAGQLLLETRIEQRHASGWFGFSYRWNEAQTEAELVLGGDALEVSWIDDDGSARTNHYQIPNANQCLTCHAQAKTFQPLGPTAANLNRPFASAHASANQIAYFRASGLLEAAPADEQVPRLPAAHTDLNATVDHRARAWLDVNCAHCHNPVGTARTSGLDLSWEQSDGTKLGVWKAPVAAGHGTGGRDYDIVPGKPDESILVHRLESEEPSVMMPNLARNLIHVEGVALIRAWIEQLDE